MKLTPVLLVDSIETSLPFWIDRLGFQKVVEVPEGNVLGFVILVNGNAEVMLQTFDSAEKDAPSVWRNAPRTVAGIGLFVVVDDFEDIRKRLKGYKIDLPERTTFYGMREIGVREPGGCIVVFAKEVEK